MADDVEGAEALLLYPGSPLPESSWSYLRFMEEVLWVLIDSCISLFWNTAVVDQFGVSE